MTKKTISCFAVLLTLILVSAVTAKPARAGWYVNNLGWLVYETDASVLGDEDEIKPEERKIEERKEEKKEIRSENQGPNREPKREVEYFDATQNAWIKAKTEPGKTKVEIKTETEREKYKLKFKSEAGILKLEAETEDGETTQLGEDNEIEIESRRDDKIRVATGSGEGEMVFSRNRIKAKTNFPLSVDLNTNELIVTTPAGVKRVTVLPDQAIAKLLESNVIDRTESTEAESEVELSEADGEPAYEISGESDQKFFGFMPVKIKSKIKVSAETGEIVKTEKTIRDRLIDLFSI